MASLTGDRYTGSGQRGQEVSMPPAVRAVMDTTGWREREWSQWTDGRGNERSVAVYACVLNGVYGEFRVKLRDLRHSAFD